MRGFVCHYHTSPLCTSESDGPPGNIGILLDSDVSDTSSWVPHAIDVEPTLEEACIRSESGDESVLHLLLN